jgi:hypothetical protein
LKEIEVAVDLLDFLKFLDLHGDSMEHKYMLNFLIFLNSLISTIIERDRSGS